MSSSWPGGTDTFTDPSGTSLVTSPDHASLHSEVNSSIRAMQSNLGTNAGTSVIANFAAGQFPLRVTGGGATGTHVTTLVGGTLANTALIGTPQITGGTITNAALIGTSQITGGTASSITLGTPTIVGTFIKVGNFTRDLSAATGTVGITGVGFQPRAVDFTGVVNGTFTSSIGWDDLVTPSCIAQDAVNVWTYDLTSSIYLQASAGARQTGSILSVNADGFVISYTKTGSPTGNAQLLYKAYR